jgi:hypothetical protein
MLMFEVYTRQRPFANLRPAEILQAYVHNTNLLSLAAALAQHYAPLGLLSVSQLYKQCNCAQRSMHHTDHAGSST